MIIIGIDPGKDGGLARWDGDEPVVAVMPVVKSGTKRVYDDNALSDLLHKWIPQHKRTLTGSAVFVERQQPMYGKRHGKDIPHSTKGSYSIGEGYGLIRGVLASLGVAREFVSPQTWQATVFKGQKSRDGTARVIRCKEWYPYTSLLRTERCSTTHDGIVDALLIMEYGRRVKYGVYQ